MTDFASAVEYLLENGYLANLNGKITITNKLHRDFNPIPRSRIEQIFPDKPEIVSKEDIWNKFMEDAEIPHRASFEGDGKQYTIRQYSLGTANELIRIIRAVPDYRILVESTKNYYRSHSFKLIFSNYLKRKVWEEQYKLYDRAVKENKLRHVLASGSGGNKFED